MTSISMLSLLMFRLRLKQMAISEMALWREVNLFWQSLKGKDIIAM